MVDEVEDLTLWQRHILCHAPLDPRDSLHEQTFVHWAVDLSRGKRASMWITPPRRVPQSAAELQLLESYHKVLDAYLWLSQRLPEAFGVPGQVSTVRAHRAACETLIERALGLLHTTASPALVRPAARGQAKTKRGRSPSRRGNTRQYYSGTKSGSYHT
mmetsp:Transcript_44473/g.100422  ORF Transcript_44473/g.100422 Transcript_44473/m.100422 type:complete len:159 (-) Transcript_44473:262-738(-)